MFLLNALQQKYTKALEEDEEAQSIAFVLFNVKGRDLLSLDKKGNLDKTNQDIYDMLQMEAKIMRIMQRHMQTSIMS